MHSWSNVFADDNTHVIFLDNFKSIVQDPNDYTKASNQPSWQAGVSDTNAKELVADFAHPPTHPPTHDYLPR